MESTNEKPALLGANAFLFLWIVIYVLVYLLLYTIDKAYWAFINGTSQEMAIQLLSFQESGTLVGFMLMAVMFGLVTSIAQMQLVKRHLALNLPQWFMMSMVGWLAGGFFSYYSEGLRYPPMTADGYVLSLIALWMPPAILQAMQLRRKSKQWWVWIVANLVGVLLFALTYWMIDGLEVQVLFRPIGFVPAAIIQGAVTVGAIFQMFPQATE